MKIEINPALWTVETATVETGDGPVVITRGDVLELDDDAAEALFEQTTSQFSKRHQIFIEAGQKTPDATIEYIAANRIDNLTKADLQRAAETYGLSVSGTKDELVSRIRAYVADVDGTEG